MVPLPPPGERVPLPLLGEMVPPPLPGEMFIFDSSMLFLVTGSEPVSVQPMSVWRYMHRAG